MVCFNWTPGKYSRYRAGRVRRVRPRIVRRATVRAVDKRDGGVIRLYDPIPLEKIPPEGRGEMK